MAGLNIAGAIGAGATVAITIRAIDKFSNEFERAKTSSAQLGVAMKGIAIGATLAFTGMAVSALKFASTVKSTDPEVIKLQKSLGELKTVGDEVKLSFAKGMAPALEQFAESAKKGQTGLSYLAKGAGSLVGGFFTGLEAIGSSIMKSNEELNKQKMYYMDLIKYGKQYADQNAEFREGEAEYNSQKATFEEEERQRMIESGEIQLKLLDENKAVLDQIYGTEAKTSEEVVKKNLLENILKSKLGENFSLIKEMYEVEKKNTEEKRNQLKIQQEITSEIAKALSKTSGGGKIAQELATKGYSASKLGEGTRIVSAESLYNERMANLASQTTLQGQAEALKQVQAIKYTPKQAGGVIEQDQMIYAHKGEQIIPAGNTSNYGGVTININGAGDPAAVARAVYKKLQAMGGV